MNSTGYIVRWNGGTAYVGCIGKVEGVDGPMWPMGKPLWMLKRMLKHRSLDYTIEELNLCLIGIDQKKEVPKRKQKEEPLVEPECKS